MQREETRRAVPTHHNDDFMNWICTGNEKMQEKTRLVSLRRVPIELDPSLFLIFGLVTWSLAAAYFPEQDLVLSGFARWLLAGFTVTLFFGSILVHELAHAYFALRNGLPVHRITLFIFGGVAHIGREPDSPKAELVISMAGPGASLGLYVLFQGLASLGANEPLLTAPSAWLAKINLMLALFNMIPGFPLDGGRVLYALVWLFSGSRRRAMPVAVFSGLAVAFGLIGFGVFKITHDGALIAGLWMVFIGWFLHRAAMNAQMQFNLQQWLTDVTVEEVMTRAPPSLSRHLLLSDVVEEKVLASSQRSFLVAENGCVHGLLAWSDITAVPRHRWPYTTVEGTMVPLEYLTPLKPQANLTSALQEMTESDTVHLPVEEYGKIVGIVSREQILYYLSLQLHLSA